MRLRVAVVLLLAALVTGCGFEVEEPDLFLVTRTGAGGQKLTLLVNDGGTIRCDGGKAKELSDPQLLQARDLATSLNSDVSAKLRFAPSARSVYSYTVNVAERHDVFSRHCRERAQGIGATGVICSTGRRESLRPKFLKNFLALPAG